MNTITKTFVFVQLMLSDATTSLQAKRDERGGGNSVENLGWIALAIAIVVLVTGAVLAYIKGKLPQ